VELVDPADVDWAKQPYHAAEGLERDDARDVVERAIASAQRVALRETRAALARAREAGHDVVTCALLAPAPMPAWSVEEILAVHFRMHKAEGVLFPDALVRAAEACGAKAVAIPEKTLGAHAKKALGAAAPRVTRTVEALGRSLGPPWGKDQKGAALAALVALAATRL
jgi:hypothetical protein